MPQLKWIVFCGFSYSKDEIDSKVTVFRKMLMDKEGVVDASTVDKDEFGRPM